MSGEANAYTMTHTNVPASEAELDHWIVVAQDMERSLDTAAAAVVIERLVCEVVMLRSLRRAPSGDQGGGE